MKKRAILTVSATCVAMLAIASIAFGTSLAGVTLRSSLDPGHQVPPQVVKAPKARATFVGTLTKLADGRSKLVWRLTYSSLSSPVTKGLLVVPQYKTRPATVVEFCARCTAGQTGKVTPLPIRVAKALTTRVAWVSIRTKKNPKGEIRGRLVVR